MKTFRIVRRSGKKLFEDDDLIAEEILEEQPVKPPQEEGYKAAVLECHEVLDGIAIPSAKGQSCEDPECKSPIGHRLRSLRDKYIANQSILDEIRKQHQRLGVGNSEEFVNSVTDLLSNNRGH